MRETGIYIHIPFCVQKCLYCDFPSFGGQEKEYERYTAALCREIEAKSHLAKDWKIKTVFFGGGTPTVLSAQQMKRILDTVFQCFNVEGDAEITTEANPGTLSLEKCVALRQMGFNRLSMGVQAWQDELLERLGRIHTRQQFLKNFASAREAGFDNINVDLMFALPEQTLGQWEETLSEITALQPEHISAYSLIIEEGTPFYDLYEKEVYQETDEELDRAMYHTAVQILAEEDYHQYEISNFAKMVKKAAITAFTGGMRDIWALVWARILIGKENGSTIPMTCIHIWSRQKTAMFPWRMWKNFLWQTNMVNLCSWDCV